MEEIKTSLDKMLANFNESITHSAPKKLSFEHLNDSLNDLYNAKRARLSNNNNSNNNSYSMESSESQISNNTPLNTTTSSLPQSPWEIRCMKADLIESKTKIMKLKKEMERQQKLNKEAENLLEDRVVELKKQCEFSTSKMQDMEKHMRVIRKREHTVREDLLKTQNELQQQKLKFDEIIMKLHKSKLDIENKAREVQNTMAVELNDAKRHADEIETELEISNEKLANVQSQLNEYKDNMLAYNELKIDYDKLVQNLEVANSQIKKMEYEISTYKDWKELMEKSHSRLLNIPEMVKEIEYLRNNNKNLQELVDNKLLLEEQVFDLRTRLEKEENNRDELVALRIQLKHAQEELKEWQQLAKDHCPSSSAPLVKIGPLLLRSRIEELLQNDVFMASERHTKVNETNSIMSELREAKQQCEIYAKNLEEVNVALKRHKAFKERVQKKLLLVSKERDCYKQLLENFEKDDTLSTTNVTEGNSIEHHLRHRIDMLEKTVMGYKEMCANMEKELITVRITNQTKDLGGIGSCSGDQATSLTPIDPTSSTYEDFKRQLHGLRMENERLHRRKEELELKLEQLYLKDSIQTDNYKIVQMITSPAAEAYKNNDNQIEKLQAEIERLRRRNKNLDEMDTGSPQNIANQTDNMTMNIKEMNQLKAEIESLNGKLKKLKDCYKSANMEFRDVVYMLFGYRIDRIGSNANYNMYAESPDDYLNFRLNESNLLDMLETPYSATLKPLIETQLVGNKSLPAFLSSLTLELFQRSTITIT